MSVRTFKAGQSWGLVVPKSVYRAVARGYELLQMMQEPLCPHISWETAFEYLSKRGTDNLAMQHDDVRVSVRRNPSHRKHR
jgi:hypothetical protein